MNVFNNFALKNPDQHSEIDYFYILDHLEESKLNVNQIKDIFQNRFNAYNSYQNNKDYVGKPLKPNNKQ